MPTNRSLVPSQKSPQRIGLGPKNQLQLLLINLRRHKLATARECLTRAALSLFFPFVLLCLVLGTVPPRK